MWLLPPVVQWKWLRKKERLGPLVKVDWNCCGISEVRFALCSTPAPLLTWSWSCTPRSSRWTHVSTTKINNPLPSLSLSLPNYNFMPSLYINFTNTHKIAPSTPHKFVKLKLAHDFFFQFIWLSSMILKSRTIKEQKTFHYLFIV